jgi:hypothetical protein
LIASLSSIAQQQREKKPNGEKQEVQHSRSIQNVTISHCANTEHRPDCKKPVVVPSRSVVTAAMREGRWHEALQLLDTVLHDDMMC